MRTLSEIYRDYPGCDKGSIHSYVEHYHKLFDRYRLPDVRFLEIGLAGGDSLKMWAEYFGRQNVVGLDLGWRQEYIPMVKDGYLIYVHNSTSRPDVEFRFRRASFDVIIDDGDHALQAQIATYRNFRPKLRKGGIYVIEDVQDIDKTRGTFRSLDQHVEIIDLRAGKGRYDDVLVVIREPQGV